MSNLTADEIVSRLRAYVEIDECEGGNPLVIEVETAAADLIERLTKQLETAKAALEPSGETKAAYMGEFTMGVTLSARGQEEHRSVQIPWTTIKEIMAAIRSKAFRSGEAKTSA